MHATHRRLTAALLTPIVAALGLTLAPASAETAAADLPGAGHTLRVVVLGDSYSAGNGADGTTYGPDGCYRNTQAWSEKYAAGLRAQGFTVELANHACSGGVTADITTPRAMDSASKTMTTPAGVTTSQQADAYLAAQDPCNTHAFPAEEFWTYATTSVNALTLSYSCTRTLRAQADFVDSDTDLVLLTMGGNDAGFTTIVAQCFVLKSASGCEDAVGAARAALPQIQQRGLAGIAALRAHGLREDARIVQLGYPWLQTDNGYTIAGVPTSYAAGDAVRSLVSDGNAAIAQIADQANVGHPGQMRFLTGVPEKFSGHEPDATTAIGNPDRWVHQAFDGDYYGWYHPNGAGHSAYADLLLAQGTFGAPTHGAPAPTTPVPTPTLTAELRAKAPKHVATGRPVKVRVRVRLSDGSTPTGRVLVRQKGHRRVLDRSRLAHIAHGRTRLKVRGLAPGRRALVVVYRGPEGLRERATVRVRLAR